MRVLDADDLDRLLPFPALIAALDDAFRADFVTPVRHHHTLARAGEPEGMLLLMPSWSNCAEAISPDAVAGVKIVTVMPGNAKRGAASVVGAYVLMSGVTGETLAVMDGTRLTVRRTAAASALAASRLARKDASHLVMVGAGSLAPYLIAAHSSIRPIRRVSIWNHNPAKAEALAASLTRDGLDVRAVADLASVLPEADIVSSATLSKEPLIEGRHLKPGAHVDLVGGFTPDMREADDEAVRRATVFVDTRAGATKEAGDIVQPLASGVLAEGAIAGDLIDLARGRHAGRTRDDEITFFKSVGTAVEDLAAAALAYRGA